jgi:hypothetical protein
VVPSLERNLVEMVQKDILGQDGGRLEAKASLV